MTNVNSIAAAIVFAALLFAYMFRFQVTPLNDRFYLVSDRLSGSTKMCAPRNAAGTFCISPGMLGQKASISVAEARGQQSSAQSVPPGPNQSTKEVATSADGIDPVIQKMIEESAKEIAMEKAQREARKRYENNAASPPQ